MFSNCTTCDRKVLPVRGSEHCPYCSNVVEKDDDSQQGGNQGESITANYTTIVAHDNSQNTHIQGSIGGRHRKRLSDSYVSSSQRLSDVGKTLIIWATMVGFVVFACFFLLSTWLPTSMFNGALGVIVLWILSTGSRSISQTWLNFVIQRRFRLSKAKELTNRFWAIPLFIVGFIFFWTIVARPYSHFLIKADMENLITSHSSQILEELGDSASSTFVLPNGRVISHVPEDTKRRVMEIMLNRHGSKIKFKLALIMGVSSAFGASLIWLALLLFNASKRSESRRANLSTTVDFQNENTNNKIAFFRSFSADARPACQEGPLSAFSLKTEEELLADASRAVGLSLIAIGRPGEYNAELGAERTYFSDSEWQSNALRMMNESRFVIMRPDKTNALRWELLQVIKTVDPTRFALWIPKTMEEEWIDFIHISEGMLPVPLPPHFSDFFPSQRDRFVVFSADWEPEELDVRSKKTEAKPWLKACLKELLHRSAQDNKIETDTPIYDLY